MTSEDGNEPPTSDQSSAADLFASISDQVVVPPLTPPKALLQPRVPENIDTAVILTPNPVQIPLTPSAGGSDISESRLCGRSRHSACASCRHQAQDNLTHLLLVAYLTNRPPLVKEVVVRLTTIYRLRTEKRAKLETLRLPEISAPSPDDINNLP